MRIYFSKPFTKRCFGKLGCLLTGLLITVSAHSHNVNGSPVPIKGSVPVSYYEGFMVAVALMYGIYLIIRARRRKHNSKFHSKAYPTHSKKTL
jgi:hypothetical protein